MLIQDRTVSYTCTAAAPVSRVLLVQDSSSPDALLVTGMSAILTRNARSSWSWFVSKC
jgi:hypothetical protein